MYNRLTRTGQTSTPTHRTGLPERGRAWKKSFRDAILAAGADPVCKPPVTLEVPMTHHLPAMACRPGCAACCIAPSISSPIPDPQGGPARPKPAGIPCGQLDEQLRCRLFGQPGRPAVCSQLAPAVDMCGSDPDPARARVHAMQFLDQLERLTAPSWARQGTTL